MVDCDYNVEAGETAGVDCNAAVVVDWKLGLLRLLHLDGFLNWLLGLSGSENLL